jgi:type I restriction enzyme R subunit
MNLHQEHHFEAEICAHLATHGWLDAEGDAENYDRTHGLHLPDLLAWPHHTLRSAGRQPLSLGADGNYKLPPMDAVGSGSVQEKQQAYLAEIIEKVNGLFEGQLTDDDQLVYVNGVLKGKLLENETLVQQAGNNSKEQFANSPDLKDALMHAIMDALEAHSTMSTQALESERVRAGLKDILLGPAQLYEALRARSQGGSAAP